MSKQALTKATAPASDGFDIVDADRASGASFVKFEAGSQSLWFYRDGAPVRRGPWIAIECRREAVQWSDDKKVVARIDESESPDLAKLNAVTPQIEGFDGSMKDAWVMTYAVYLVDPENGEKIISSNSTFGQRGAFSALKDAVQFRRKYRGEQVVPVVELSSKSMKTRFGLKARPHFEILEWRQVGGAPVAALTASELVNDEIPDRLIVGGKPISFDDDIGDLDP